MPGMNIPSLQEPLTTVTQTPKKPEIQTPRSEKSGRLNVSFTSNKESESSLDTSNWDESFDYSRDDGLIELEPVHKDIISWDKLLHTQSGKQFYIEAKKEEKPVYSSEKSYGWENITSHYNFEAAYNR